MDRAMITPPPWGGDGQVGVGVSPAAAWSAGPTRSGPGVAPTAGRVVVDGKFFRLGGLKWYVKGFTYGPFAPNGRGEPLPERHRLERDLADVRRLGGNVLRLYHVPPAHLLDAALEHDLRVFIDVPWEKHRCFLEDWSSQEDALKRVRDTARQLGRHPAVFALSVGNEVPHDVVRFHGARRVQRFIDRLVDAARQEAPDCLVTYANYPSTEFLEPARLDFYCANVYLEDAGKLSAYLDRLQHVAGPLPLVLGEFGVDTIRKGEGAQAKLLADHVRQVFRRGLAGSFVFAYTDDWFTGGDQIRDWAFGVTRADRSPKPAAAELSRVWAQVPRVTEAPADSGASAADPSEAAWPSVSVVVCSYNGAATLEPCLRSLMELDYPDHEVILVDDGSTDDTPAIAARFPGVRCIRQPNLGLSVARNRGAEAARGQVVAYTDSDCVADELWLHHLVQAMRDQGVAAIGGPNVPPPADGWTARCVAASPGGPSHVMIDDRRAEHVPGCNMAFRRDALLALGGFDPQFRQAGDDVDVCWRFLDAGLGIGYAPAALVWHHRRNTVRAYLKQQKGYGRAEGMLALKHPHRFNEAGAARWHGVIYGEGAVGLPVLPPPVYHGRFGAAPFQVVYRQNRYGAWAYATSFEWHLLAALIATFGLLWPAALLATAAMELLTLVAAGREALRVDLPQGSPRWCRPLVFVLHVLQPAVRGWHRWAWRLTRRRLPAGAPAGPEAAAADGHVKWISFAERDLYFDSARARGREHLLDALEEAARRGGWKGDFRAEWDAHDVSLFADAWHDVELRTATEELGWPRRFTRVRCALRPTLLARAAGAAAGAWTVAAALATWSRSAPWPLLAAAGLWLVLFAAAARSRRRCRRAVAGLVFSAGEAAGLEPVPHGRPARRPREATAPGPARRAPEARAEPDPAALPACAE